MTEAYQYFFSLVKDHLRTGPTCTVRVGPVRYNESVPAKHVIKVYVENGYYHLLNRGVDKRPFFLDSGDYKKFLSLLKRYLTNPDILPEHLQPPRPIRRSDLYEKIKLIAYCLMPNHFHLLVKQETRNAITKFARSLSNAYVRYFNDRYKRVGALFQGKIKGVLVDSDAYLLHLSRYIHQNPEEVWDKGLRDYPYSSYAEYLGFRNTQWIYPEIVLDFFSSSENNLFYDYFSYRSFVEKPKEETPKLIQRLTFE